MSRTEFQHLRRFEMASRFSPRQAVHIVSRRQAKSKANATGQHGLRSFRVVAGVGLNTVFKRYD